MFGLTAQIRPRIIEDGAGGADGGGKPPTAEAVQAGHLEMSTETIGRHLGVEQPVLQRRPNQIRRHIGEATFLPCLVLLFADQAFGRLQSIQLGFQFGLPPYFGDAEVSRAEIQQGQAENLFHRGDGNEEIAAGCLENPVVQDRAWRDDLGDLAPHESLGELGVFHLLGDGDLDALLEHAGHVRLQRMMGNAAHGHAGTLGQDNVHQLGAAFRILKEKLVEIPHAKEQDRVVAHFFFRLHILSHGRRKFRMVGHWDPTAECGKSYLTSCTVMKPAAPQNQGEFGEFTRRDRRPELLLHASRAAKGNKPVPPARRWSQPRRCSERVCVPM